MAASSLTSGPQPAPNARGQGLLFQGAKPYAAGVAGVAELVDALDLGSSAARRGGSSPFFRTRVITILTVPFFQDIKET